jgi:hypothetical protein
MPIDVDELDLFHYPSRYVDITRTMRERLDITVYPGAVYPRSISEKACKSVFNCQATRPVYRSITLPVTLYFHRGKFSINK